MKDRAEQKQKSDDERNILSTAKGGSILFTGQLFEYGINILFAVLIARLLGADGFGMYRLALAVVAVLAALSPLGLSGGLDRFVPIARKAKDDARLWGVIQVGLGIPLLVGIGVSIALSLSADLIAIGLFKEPGLAPLLRIVAAAVPLHVMSKGLASIAIGFRKAQYEVYAQNIAFNVVKLLLSVGALAIGLGVSGVSGAYLVAETSAVLILVIMVNKLFSFRRPLSEGKRNTREMFNFSLPLFLSTFLNQFGRRFETLILGVFGIVADVGVYSAILSVSAVGNMGFVALRKVSSPLFAELHSQGKIQEMEKLYQTTTKWSMAFNLPFFMTMVLFAENILLIYGKDFTVGDMGLVILAVGTLVDASTGACGTIINMSGHSRISFLNSFIYFGATFLFDFLLIPKYFLIGAAVAGALTLILVNVLRIIQVYRLIGGILPFHWSFWKPIASALVAGILTYLTKDFVFPDSPILQLGVMCSAMWIVYIGMIFTLKLSPEDRLVVAGVWNKFAPKRFARMSER